MESCAMCGGPSRESVLVFSHLRECQRVDLEMPLCEVCGTRIEKHLKRAVPKRLMRIRSVGPLPVGQGDGSGARRRQRRGDPLAA